MLINDLHQIEEIKKINELKQEILIMHHLNIKKRKKTNKYINYRDFVLTKKF